MAEPATERPTPVLETRALTKHYGGVRALEGADLAIAPGEQVAIVGDNGAGKSTFVRGISGVERPTSGSVLVGGAEMSFAAPAEARAAGIETVYQDLALAGHLDVPANIFLGREIHRMRLGPLSWLDKRRMREEAERLLARTGIKIPDMSQPLMRLSGGQRQSVAITRAAGWGSRLIIMDEPTAALGVQETQKVEEIIRGLRGSDTAVLMVSHNLRQVFDLVDRVVVFRRGRIVGDRRTADASAEDIVALITGADAGSELAHV